MRIRWPAGICCWWLALLAVAGATTVLAQVADRAAQPMPGMMVPRGVPRSFSMGLPLGSLFEPANRVTTPRLDVAALLAEDAQEKFGPDRIGVVQDFLPQDVSRGKWTALPDGGHLWTASFAAPDARAMRLRIRPWSPPPGAELFVFNAGNPAESYGPFTSSYPLREPEFWTAVVYAGEVDVEYYLPPGLDPLAPRSGITVDGLLNQYRDPLLMQTTELPCHLDVTCYPSWAAEALGVVAVASISYPYGYYCTAELLNRIPTDYTPLLTIANHCGVNPGNETSLLVTWFYQTSVCNGVPPDPSTLPQTLGCAALVNDGSTDFTMAGLQSNVPGGATYLGWDAGHWDNGGAAIMIHHPRGTYKRITFGTKTADVTSCIPAAAWHIDVPNNNGEDEPGSSGAPLFDAAHRIRGTASCATWNCYSPDVIEAGRLDLAFSKLSPYLTPVDPVYVNGAYGGTEQGTSGQPFNRFKKGYFGVIRGHDLYVEGGSYNETLIIDKAMVIHARNGTVVIGQ